MSSLFDNIFIVSNICSEIEFAELLGVLRSARLMPRAIDIRRSFCRMAFEIAGAALAGRGGTFPALCAGNH